MKFGVRKLESW